MRTYIYTRLVLVLKNYVNKRQWLRALDNSAEFGEPRASLFPVIVVVSLILNSCGRRRMHISAPCCLKSNCEHSLCGISRTVSFHLLFAGTGFIPIGSNSVPQIGTRITACEPKYQPDIYIDICTKDASRIVSTTHY